VLADKVALASGSAMRVRVGPYADRATAEAARLRAEEITGTAGKVVAADAARERAAKPAVAAREAGSEARSRPPSRAARRRPKPSAASAAAWLRRAAVGAERGGGRQSRCATRRVRRA
jgi:hypothetical protein